MTAAPPDCAHGDTKVSFDPKDPEEVQTAREVVSDMLRRGYCVSVIVDGKPERVTGFDPTKDEYIVATRRTAGEPKPKRGGRRVKAAETKAVAVGRTAGGGRGELPRVLTWRSIGALL